ncbi:MAG: aldo/keto reductase, partial [Lachnospiraceae bacterium]|nr:aldo/keto reductase [Lachnospiraceae bacterium]
METMKYNKLGLTDLKVSEICLGTMTFGEKIGADEAEKSVQYAFDRGVNFIDTADIYPRGAQGESERIVGKAVREFRDKVILATKVGGPMGSGRNDKGLGRVHIQKAVDGSLGRLQTDYIDLYYLHIPDPTVDIAEVLDTMDELVKAGKIRYYGVSNYPEWQVCEMKWMAS